MRLLLAIDDSPSAATAVGEVAARSWPDDTDIRVLTVTGIPLGVPVPQMPVATGPVASTAGSEQQPGYPEIQPAIDELSRRIAQQGVDALAAHGVGARLRVRQGTPGTEIVREAEEWQADLIVMGSRGHGAIKRLFLGSVADYVVHHAPCSVQVVKQRQEHAPAS